MTTPTTTPAGSRDGADDTHDDRAVTGSTDNGSASPAVVPASGRPDGPVRRSTAGKVLVGLVAATAVLALVLLMPGLLAALAICAGLVALGSFALIISSPWLLLGVVAVVALVIATRRPSHPQAAG